MDGWAIVAAAGVSSSSIDGTSAVTALVSLKPA